MPKGTAASTLQCCDKAGRGESGVQSTVGATAHTCPTDLHDPASVHRNELQTVGELTHVHEHDRVAAWRVGVLLRGCISVLDEAWLDSKPEPANTYW